MKMLLWCIVVTLLFGVWLAWSRPNNEPKMAAPAPVSPEAESVVPSPTEPVSISVSPAAVIQGEPALIGIHGPVSLAAIDSLTLDGKPLTVFSDGDKLGAVVGIDLHRKPGPYPIVLTLKDGQKIESALNVGERILATEAFDIPEQLGGNTPQAERDLTDTLAKDTATLNAVTATVRPDKLWSGEFRLPLDGPLTVTDTYGYGRQTGSVNLSHNGTDFRAREGTPVYAMNSGVVAFAGSFRNYGNTVVIDHGLGVMTISMHLSEINVKPEESVAKGDRIASSGNTGYSLGPHLHLSVRIGGYSIDPMKFLALMGPR